MINISWRMLFSVFCVHWRQLKLESLNVPPSTVKVDYRWLAFCCHMCERNSGYKTKSREFPSCLLKHKMMCETFHLAPFTALHAHRPPQHFKGCAPAHAHLSPSEYYRSEFYKVHNVLYTQFRERFELRGMQMIKIWNLGCKSYNQALITLPENTPSTN